MLSSVVVKVWVFEVADWNSRLHKASRICWRLERVYSKLFAKKEPFSRSQIECNRTKLIQRLFWFGCFSLGLPIDAHRWPLIESNFEISKWNWYPQEPQFVLPAIILSSFYKFILMALNSTHRIGRDLLSQWTLVGSDLSIRIDRCKLVRLAR